MATVINAGRVAMVPKGEWSASTAYTRLDVVQHGGSAWVCIQDGTGQEPASGSTYWQLLAAGITATNYYTKSQVDTALQGKQDALVSGQNIKTVNNESLLGSGNVTIAGGEDGKSAYQSYLDTTSDNPPKTEAQWIASLKGEDGVGFAAASSPTTADGTWQITLTNGDTITINLNHTHENMAKLVVCEESDLPSTLAKDTIYAQVDDAADPTEIQSLWIAGLEFIGGGEPDYTPKLTSPRNGTTIDFDGQSTATIVVKGKNLTSNLSVVVTGDFTVTANGQSVSTIDAANVTNGASVSLLLTKGSGFTGGTIVIRSTDLSEDVSLNILDSSAIVALTGVKFTGTQWLETDYKANPKTEFILKCRLETTSITDVIDGVNRKNWILGGNDANGCYELYHISNKQTGGSNAPYNLNISLNSLSESRMLLSNASNMLTDPLIIQYSKTNGLLTAGTGSINVVAKKGNNSGNLRICCRLTNGEDICYSRFYLTIYEFSIIEDGVNVRHYIPMRRFGSPGLYDTVTGSFLTSKTNDPLVEVNS